jgi:DNA uptake protein ComE-like DNA-binding protein
MNQPSQGRWRRAGVWLIAAGVCGTVLYVAALRSPGRTEFTPLPQRTVPLPNDLRRGFQSSGAAPAPPQVRTFKTVDLNEASLEELQTLPQITPEYARKLMAGRPYSSIAELARTGIPREILDQISPPGIIRIPERGGPLAGPPRRGMPPPGPPRGGMPPGPPRGGSRP